MSRNTPEIIQDSEENQSLWSLKKSTMKSGKKLTSIFIGARSIWDKIKLNPFKKESTSKITIYSKEDSNNNLSRKNIPQITSETLTIIDKDRWFLRQRKKLKLRQLRTVLKIKFGIGIPQIFMMNIKVSKKINKKKEPITTILIFQSLIVKNQSKILTENKSVSA